MDKAGQYECRFPHYVGLDRTFNVLVEGLYAPETMMKYTVILLFQLHRIGSIGRQRIKTQAKVKMSCFIVRQMANRFPRSVSTRTASVCSLFYPMAKAKKI
jgi:hypothetical protein